MPCYDGAMFPLPIRHMLHSSHPLPLRALMTGVTRNEWSRNMGWFLTDLLYTRDDLGKLFTSDSLITRAGRFLYKSSAE